MYVSAILLVPNTQALAVRNPELLSAEIFRIQAAELEVSTGALIALVREKDEIIFSNFQLKELTAMLIRNPVVKLPEKKEDSRTFRSIEI